MKFLFSLQPTTVSARFCLVALVILLSYSATFAATDNGSLDGSSTSTTKQVDDRNYELGVVRSAYVGEPVVRVRRYEVRTDSSVSLVTPVEVTGKLRPWGGEHRIPAGTTLVPFGLVKHKGQSFMALQFPERDLSIYPILVDADGRFTGLTYTTVHRKVIESSPKNIIEYRPADLTLERKTTETVVASGSFVNYEIVYSGSSGDTLTLLYREYSPDDLARPAFSQSLTYDPKQPTIRFRSLVIELRGANNEKIDYVVTADDSRPKL